MPSEKNIVLTIKGMQESVEGKQSEVELMTEGTFAVDGEIARILYQESEIIGSDGAMMCIEMQDDIIRITRSGGFGANFEMLEGRRCLTLYSTPYGMMEVGAYPSIVEYTIGENGGHIELLYDLEIQGRSAGKNHLHMDWRDSG